MLKQKSVCFLFFSPPCSISYPEANPDLDATKLYLKSTILSITSPVTSVYGITFSRLN